MLDQEYKMARSGSEENANANHEVKEGIRTSFPTLPSSETVNANSKILR